VLCVRHFEHCQYQRPSARNRECLRPPHSGQTKPSGQRARSSAFSQAASVPYCSMNLLKDIPCWNWIRFWGIGGAPLVDLPTSVRRGQAQPASPLAEESS
jgi:hypothetical protein